MGAAAMAHVRHTGEAPARQAAGARLPGTGELERGGRTDPDAPPRRIPRLPRPGGGAHPLHASTALVEGKVVGWFHGRMEFGPRSLGARSILADPAAPGHAGPHQRGGQDARGFPPFRSGGAGVRRRGSTSRSTILRPSCWRPARSSHPSSCRRSPTLTARRACRRSSRETNPRFAALLAEFDRAPAAPSCSTPRSTCAASPSSAARSTRSSAS